MSFPLAHELELHEERTGVCPAPTGLMEGEVGAAESEEPEQAPLLCGRGSTETEKLEERPMAGSPALPAHSL
jgi:hypothetical protein